MAPSTRDVRKVLDELAARSSEKDEVFVEFNNIDPKAARKIFAEIDHRLETQQVRATYNSKTSSLSFVLMPSPIHNSHQAWLIASLQLASMGTTPLFDITETKNMRVTSGTRYKAFLQPYSQSVKEPDQCISVSSQLPKSTISSVTLNLHKKGKQVESRLCLFQPTRGAKRMNM
jgi:hypothetical protein